MGLLDGGIAGIVNNALKGIFLDFTLIRKVVQANADEPWQKNVITEKSYSCKAITADYKAFEIDGERIKNTDKKILILANSLAVEPQVGDIIKQVGEKNTYSLTLYIKTDPAKAVYECQGR